VDLVTLTEDVGGHLGMPVTRLVTEMHASFEHLAHAGIAHCLLLIEV
jgi:hypothetical protein